MYVNAKFFFLEAKTNEIGFFSVPHRIQEAETIIGMTMAIQHRDNKNWHTIEISNHVDNRFWWNATDVQGLMVSPAFVKDPPNEDPHNFPAQQVRIVLITR